MRVNQRQVMWFLTADTDFHKNKRERARRVACVHACSLRNSRTHSVPKLVLRKLLRFSEGVCPLERMLAKHGVNRFGVTHGQHPELQYMLGVMY